MGQTKILTEKQCFSRIGAAYFALAALTICLQFVLIGVVAWCAPDFARSVIFSWVASLAPMYLVAAPICMKLLWRVPGARPPQSKMGAKQFFKWLLICFGVMYTGSLLGQIVMQLVGAVRGAPMADNMSDMIRASGVVVNFVVTVLLAPVIEESLFRKLLIDRTRQFGEGLAIVLSGVLFGLFHGNFYQFFYAAGVGMVFAYVYVRTGRLRYPILMHMVINFMGAVVAPFMLQISAAALGSMSLTGPALLRMALLGLYMAALLGCTIAGLTLLVHEQKHLVLQEGACPIFRGQRFRTVAGNGGMLAFLLISVLLFAMNLLAG